MIKQLPALVSAVLSEWFTSHFQLLYFWEQDDTYFITGLNEGKLYFVRVFQISGEWVLSQDTVIGIEKAVEEAASDDKEGSPQV